jgi:hypothetical protein
MSTPVKRPSGIRRQSSGKKRSRHSPAEILADQKKKAAAETEAANNLSFAELRKATIVPKVTNDIAWAGRLQPFAPFWWRLFTKAAVAGLLITVLSLGLVVWSVYTRHAPLLVGVYPNGSELCFPEMVNRQGHLVPRDPVYNGLCAALSARSGAMWVLDPSHVATDAAAVQSNTPVEHYLTVEEALSQISSPAPSAFSGAAELPDGPKPGGRP